jgi:hypothetical protein
VVINNIVSLQRYSFTQIASPSATYADTALSIKQNNISFEQGFQFNYIDALSAAGDATINNYSALYLTNLKRDTEIFNFDELDYPVIDYVTPFRNIDNVLVFDVVNAFAQPGKHSYSFAQSSTLVDKSVMFFEIEIYDDNLCRIKRRSGDLNYYLVYDTTVSNFYFLTSYDFANYNFNLQSIDAFSYILDKDGYGVFFKKVGFDTFVLSVSNQNFALVSYTPTYNYLNAVSLFYLDLTSTQIQLKLNTSWVSYNADTNFNDLTINSTKSVGDLVSNNICHFEYNSIVDTSKVDMNVLKMKNILSEKNFIKRDNSTFVSSDNVPTPLFREYTSLFTGNNEEGGYENIALNFVCYNQDFTINNGKTIVTAPSSIFPYDRLNINDASFVKDGALASTNPVLADKVYKQEIDTTNPFAGNYIVTWLSGGSDYNLWVDRYYFPNINELLNVVQTSTVYSPTTSNPIVSFLSNPANRDIVAKQQYVDVISNVTITPNSKFTYERISDADVTSIIDTIPGNIQTGFTQYYTANDTPINVSTNSLTFDGDKSVSIPIENITRSGSFTLSFKIKGGWQKNTSYIVTPAVDSGITIYNDNKITPFIYTKSKNNVYVYNTENTLIYSLSFPSNVLDIISADHLQNYFVTTTNNNLYKIGPTGAIKTIYSLNSLIPATNYINYTLSGNTLAFLTDINGGCAVINTLNGSMSSRVATPFLSAGNYTNIHFYDNILYGLHGDKVIQQGTTLYNLISNSRIESYNLQITGDKEIFVVSNSRINDFTVDNDGMVYVLHDINKLAKINQARRLLSVETLFTNLTATQIDHISTYNGNYTFMPIVLARDADLNYSIYNLTPALSSTPTQLTEISGSNSLFDYTNKTLNDYATFISTNKPQCLTNYPYFINNTSKDNLNIDFKLKNIYDDTDVNTIHYEINLDDLSEYENSILITYNTEEGYYKIIINDNVVYNTTIDKSKYRINTVATNDIRLGSISVGNNITLDGFINIKGYNVLRNATIDNLKVYSSGINELQEQAILLDNTNVSPINITIPCGQRNNIEDIQTLFKFTQPYSKSDKVNIVIKNANINDARLEQEISANIYNNLSDVLPADVNINNISFINY